MLPTGTVTFLFTDIEGSTSLWEQMPVEMQAAEIQHHAILRQVIECHGGHVFQILGDAFQAAFRLASDGLNAAIEAQRALQAAEWGATGPIRVRMGLHTGPAELSPVPGPDGITEYLVSHTLNRSARVMSSGHGGQILLSQVTANLVEHDLPVAVSLRDLGEHRLKGMTRPERLYQVVAADLPQVFPPLTTAVDRPNNLPVYLTSFIGREPDIVEVCLRLRQNRLVTLTGSGGTGKTRLSVRVAEELLEEFPDGIWFVEFAPVADPELVDQTVAATLGLHKTSENSYQAILDTYLRGKRLLLILDNCEHLLEACARVAYQLLQHCPQLTLLASSREALGIAGEMAYRVPSMDAPDPRTASTPDDLAQAESVRLFAERARTVLPGFSLSDETLPAVARICHRLDGIPLAIELAAARVMVLSVEQIAARLDDRFRLLTGGSRTDLPRQRTLRASIDWSYNLLPEGERLLLQRLSVFAGGWNLQAAEAVCAGEEPESGLKAWEILDALTGLVEKSLVVADHQSGEDTRYQMLETIRQYASEKLAEERIGDGWQGTAIRDRHLAYFLSLAEAYEPLLRTPKIFELLARLDLELDNLRGALTWALSRNDRAGAEQALRMLSSLFYFWSTRLLISETDGWILRACKLIPEDDPHAAGLKAWSLLVLALLKYQFEYYVRETLNHLNTSIALFRRTGDFQENRLKLALALAARKTATHQFLHLFPPEPSIQMDGAQKDGEESLFLVQVHGNAEDPESRWFISWIYLLNARVEFTGGEKGEISALSKTAHEISVLLGDQVAELFILSTLVWLYLTDDPEQCMIYAKQGVTLARRLGDKGSGLIVGFYGTLGLSAYLTSQFFDMENYFRSIEEIFRNSPLANHVWGEAWITRMRGVATVNQPDASKAKFLLIKALNLAMTNEDPYGVLSTLVHFSGLAISLAQDQAAVRLLGFVERQFEGFFKEMDTTPDSIEFKKHTKRVKERLSAADFTALWTAGRTMTAEQAIQIARALAVD